MRGYQTKKQTDTFHFFALSFSGVNMVLIFTKTEVLFFFECELSNLDGLAGESDLDDGNDCFFGVMGGDGRAALPLAPFAACDSLTTLITVEPMAVEVSLATGAS